MTNNVNQVTILAPTYTFWTVLSGTYPMGTTGTIANGSGAGMGRLRGVNQVNIPKPAAGRVTPLGDNGPITVFTTQAQELPSGTIDLVVLDQNFAAKANGAKVYADGDWDEVGDGQPCPAFADIGFVFNCPANSQEAGSIDEAGWNVYEYYKVQVDAALVGQMQTGQSPTFPNAVTTKRANANFVGRTFTVTDDNGTSWIVKQYWSSHPVTYYTFIGDGSTTTATLNELPPAATGTAVQYWLNGVKKTYTTDYTVSTSTGVVTFVVAPTAGAKAIIKHKFVATC